MPSKTKAKPQELDGQRIEPMTDFLLSNGILFELNRTLLHQIGLALVVVDSGHGPELALIDGRDRPELLVFDQSTFDSARKKWRRYWETEGIRAHQTRKRKLGITTQTAADYTTQPDFRRYNQRTTA